MLKFFLKISFIFIYFVCVNMWVQCVRAHMEAKVQFFGEWSLLLHQSQRWNSGVRLSSRSLYLLSQLADPFLMF